MENLEIKLADHSDVTTIKSETVMAVQHVDENTTLFFSAGGKWVRGMEHGDLVSKETIFEKLCELPNWNEICGSVGFMNITELQEFLVH